MSVHLDREHTSQVRFLFETRKGRVGPSLVGSVAAHFVFLGLALVLVRLTPQLQIAQDIPEPAKNIGIVWLPVEGPGGGGGGGGNQSPEPPRKVELPGRDKVTIPVAKPPRLDLTKVAKDNPPPEPELNIPAVALAAGLDVLPGTLEGVPAAVFSQGSGSGGGAGTGRGTGIGPGEGSGLGPGYGGGTGGGAYRPGSGVTVPRVVREVKPQYTAEAMRAKVQGTVLLEVVVLPDGGVGQVSITRSLDPVFGLDEEAIKAARQWRFVPGTRLGEPVAVLVSIEMTFTLR